MEEEIVKVTNNKSQNYIIATLILLLLLLTSTIIYILLTDEKVKSESVQVNNVQEVLDNEQDDIDELTKSLNEDTTDVISDTPEMSTISIDIPYLEVSDVEFPSNWETVVTTSTGNDSGLGYYEIDSPLSVKVNDIEQMIGTYKNQLEFFSMQFNGDVVVLLNTVPGYNQKKFTGESASFVNIIDNLYRFKEDSSWVYTNVIDECIDTSMERCYSPGYAFIKSDNLALGITLNSGGTTELDELDTFVTDLLGY